MPKKQGKLCTAHKQNRLADASVSEIGVVCEQLSKLTKPQLLKSEADDKTIVCIQDAASVLRCSHTTLLSTCPSNQKNKQLRIRIMTPHHQLANRTQPNHNHFPTLIQSKAEVASLLIKLTALLAQVPSSHGSEILSLHKTSSIVFSVSSTNIYSIKVLQLSSESSF
jgi:hypothetical protein